MVSHNESGRSVSGARQIDYHLSSQLQSASCKFGREVWTVASDEPGTRPGRSLGSRRGFLCSFPEFSTRVTGIVCFINDVNALEPDFAGGSLSSVIEGDVHAISGSLNNITWFLVSSLVVSHGFPANCPPPLLCAHHQCPRLGVKLSRVYVRIGGG